MASLVDGLEPEEADLVIGWESAALSGVSLLSAALADCADGELLG